jgi:hypothetical protein
MTNNIIIIAVIVNAIISQVIATLVKNRQISSSRVFWLSFLLSPFVGMFVAMMAPEVKGETKEVITEGELDLPKYNKNEDGLVKFIDNNLIYLLVGIITIIFVTGLYK